MLHINSKQVNVHWITQKSKQLFVGCVNNPRVGKKLGKEILKTNLPGQRKKIQRKWVKERVISEVVILVITSWVIYLWLEGAAPGCPSHQHCTGTLLGQENMSSPIPAPKALGLSQAPPWQEEHGPNAVGGRRGLRGCCTLNQTPVPLQLSVHDSHH